METGRMDDDGGVADRHPFVLHPHRTVVTLSLPVLLSLVAEPLTGIADTAFVARLGSAPMAGLGVAAVLLSSVFWVFNFLGIGTQTEVARADAHGYRARRVGNRSPDRKTLASAMPTDTG